MTIMGAQQPVMSNRKSKVKLVLAYDLSEFDIPRYADIYRPSTGLNERP